MARDDIHLGDCRPFRPPAHSPRTPNAGGPSFNSYMPAPHSPRTPNAGGAHITHTAQPQAYQAPIANRPAQPNFLQPGGGDYTPAAPFDAGQYVGGIRAANHDATISMLKSQALIWGGAVGTQAYINNRNARKTQEGWTLGEYSATFSGDVAQQVKDQMAQDVAKAIWQGKHVRVKIIFPKSLSPGDLEV